MAKQIEKHTHKLRRHRYSSGNVVYFCALPDCSYKISPALALGKRAICWRCGEEFILSEYAIRLAKPHCENCHKPKGSDGGAVSFDTETATNPEILTIANSEIPIEPLSGQRINTAADLRNRLTSVLHSKADDEGDI